MTSPAAPLALAMGFLILAIVLAMVLIPLLDAELRRTTARRAAALSKLSPAEPQKDRAL